MKEGTSTPPSQGLESSAPKIIKWWRGNNPEQAYKSGRCRKDTGLAGKYY